MLERQQTHELYHVFNKIFHNIQHRDSYFTDLLEKNIDFLTIQEVMNAPMVQHITSDPEIIRRAINTYRVSLLLESG